MSKKDLVSASVVEYAQRHRDEILAGRDDRITVLARRPSDGLRMHERELNDLLCRFGIRFAGVFGSVVSGKDTDAK